MMTERYARFPVIASLVASSVVRRVVIYIVALLTRLVAPLSHCSGRLGVLRTRRQPSEAALHRLWNLYTSPL